ncbi:hypothetical protein [Vibrio sp. ER1A]|uniref:hypothetical protein n=1 Tax=Vibrio sp. ER1A TaxID=1517681 RepID=UPI00056F291A|nr:hypothetical protein [Vibrio sp. ER1A]
MTIFDLLVAIIVGFITAFPICRIAKNQGVKADWWVMLVLALIPVIQIPYLYWIAFKKGQ